MRAVALQVTSIITMFSAGCDKDNW